MTKKSTVTKTKKCASTPVKTIPVTPRRTVLVKLTQAELVHIRDLFGILLPPAATQTLSQALAECKGRAIVEACLWRKLSKAAAAAGVPLGDDAPDFAVSISSVPSIGVFQIEPDDDDEAAASETSGALAAALAGAEEG